VGPSLNDEKPGRPEIAPRDPTRYAALMCGGWDPKAQVPNRVRFLGIACRNTTWFSDLTSLTDISRETGTGVMLGLFTTDVDFTDPPLPAGKYWVLADPSRNVADPKVLPLVFQASSDPDKRYPGRVGADRIYLSRSAERTQLQIHPTGRTLTIRLSFPVRDREGVRFVVEMALEAPEGILTSFR
jgi:hypothetical protein